MTSEAGTSDVLVVGAGPAGLAAAGAAAKAGCEVALVDAGQRPGGQYYRHLPFDVAPHQEALHRDLAHGRALMSVTEHARVRHLAGATVWHADFDGTGVRLRVLRADGEEEQLTARACVLAPGAYDRPLPFPGWDLPGVLTAGGAQALLKGQLVLAGERVLVAGSGPFLLPVAAGLAAAGAHVAAVVEASRLSRWGRHLTAVAGSPDKLGEAAHYLATLARHRVPVLGGRAVVRAEGDGAVRRAVVARIGRDWRPSPGTERKYDVDAVCVGYGFVPSVEIAVGLGCAVHVDPADGAVVADVDARQATSVPGVYAAGEITGVAGSSAAEVEGRIAGLAVAARLGRLAEPAFARAVGPLRRRLHRHRRFAAALADVYAVRPGWTSWVSPDTVVCRCEEVRAEAVRHAVAELGATDARSVKLLTRAGMGLCQGRMCGSAVAALVPGGSSIAFADRPIATPVPLRALAAGAPGEAGGAAIESAKGGRDDAGH